MSDRQAAHQRGHAGESLAAWWLRLKGYRILARRLKTHAGEIDLVAAAPFGPICFVEEGAAFGAASRGIGHGRAADSHCPRRLLISRQPSGAGPARQPL